MKLRLQSHDQDVNDIPYKPAIEELRSISSKVTLLGKLESLGTDFQINRSPQQAKICGIHVILALIINEISLSAILWFINVSGDINCVFCK